MSGAAWPAFQCGQTALNEPPKTAVISGEVLPPIPAKQAKRMKLGTIREIRAELARVYRATKRGEIDLKTGTSLTYMLTQLANLTMDSAIEERLGALEQGE